MTTSINATTTSGLVITPDNTGLLQVQTAGVTAMSINSSQVATFVNEIQAPNGIGGTPAFSAYNSTTQSITGGSWTKITLDSKEFDTNSNFSSSRFTPNVTGYYQVIGCVRIDASNQNPLASSIYKNGSVYKYGAQYNLTSGSSSLTIAPVTCIVYLNGSTDYIELYGYASTTGTVSSASTSVFLQAIMIRGA